jgi:hypothetical protein
MRTWDHAQHACSKRVAYAAEWTATWAVRYSMQLRFSNELPDVRGYKYENILVLVL